MTNDSPPSPPNSRTPRIQEPVDYNDMSSHGIKWRDIGPYNQGTTTHKNLVLQTQSIEEYYKDYITSLMQEHADAIHTRDREIDAWKSNVDKRTTTLNTQHHKWLS